MLVSLCVAPPTPDQIAFRKDVASPDSTLWLEIVDEFDREEPTVARTADGEVLVDARISIDEFNDEFHTDVVPHGFDTLGGLLFTRLVRIPSTGDLVEEVGLRLQVTATAGRRIKTVRVMLQPTSVDADAVENEASESA